MQNLTKIQLYFNCLKDLEWKEGIISDKHYKNEVAMDNSMTWFEGNTSFVFVSNRADKRVILDLEKYS